MVALGRCVMAPPEISVLMQDSAEMMAEMLGLEHSATAEFDPSESQLLLSLFLRNEVEPGRVIDEASAAGRQSLAGYALETGRPTAVTGWNREDRFSDPVLRKHGIQSAVAVPLRVENRSFGALVAGSSRIVPFSEDDLLFAENISHLVTATIARRKTEETLEQERSFSVGLLQSVGAMVLVLDPDGRVLRINPTCERITGFLPSDVRDRRIWEVFPVSEKSDLFAVIFDKLRSGASPVEYESSLLTKDSEKRHIAWTYSGVCAPDGSLARIIASGVDLTEQRMAEEEVERLEKAARSASSPTSDGGAALKPRGGPPSAAAAERRGSPRRPYPYHQAIGYILESRLPDPADFHETECHDISASGFSFLSRRPPQSDKLVVALGNPSRLTYIAAYIVHATRVEHNGRRLFLIGCTFSGRVHYGTQ
jgi:PAS domain S-box-containing protein